MTALTVERRAGKKPDACAGLKKFGDGDAFE